MTSSVKEFIDIFKTALFKFYRIKSYMRSQEDMFIELVTKRVLDCSVSEVLIRVEKELHRDENEFFQLAVKMMNHKEVSFWLNTSDS